MRIEGASGVLPLFDPPRDQAKATIAGARKMGVSVKMPTGDQIAIARETAGRLGLGTNILDASGLGDTRHHESATSTESIEKADGFAQIGVVAAFGLFYLGERAFHLDRAHIQTLMYLKLSVAGHLTIFLTRTRGPFWSIRPARALWIAVLGTQIIATLIAVYGLFMTPLGWGWAALVWVYALAWFLLNDRIKLLAYRIFDPTRTQLLVTTHESHAS